MKKEYLFGIIGLVLGIFIMGLTAYRAAPGMMLKEAESN